MDKTRKRQLLREMIRNKFSRLEMDITTYNKLLKYIDIIKEERIDYIIYENAFIRSLIKNKKTRKLINKIPNARQMIAADRKAELAKYPNEYGSLTGGKKKPRNIGTMIKHAKKLRKGIVRGADNIKKLSAEIDKKAPGVGTELRTKMFTVPNVNKAIANLKKAKQMGYNTKKMHASGMGLDD